MDNDPIWKEPQEEEEEEQVFCQDCQHLFKIKWLSSEQTQQEIGDNPVLFVTENKRFVELADNTHLCSQCFLRRENDE